MLRPLYDLQLQHLLQVGRVTIGEFVPGELYLAAANLANKVVICRLPNTSALASRMLQTRESMQILNINESVTALHAGRFSKDHKTDFLFVGTLTELIVYDVQSNREVFRKNTTGGASSIVVGKTGRLKQTMVLVGGQSSLQGFDEMGNEPLWTLTGDNVSVLALFDINRDGQTEVIAGCDDNQIRIFRETEQIYSMMETDKVLSLAPLKDQYIAYGLANGTLGVYEQYERRWRIKSKSKPTALLGLDVNGDGEPEILCGWSSGKFEVRNRSNGETLFKHQMDEPIANVVTLPEHASVKSGLVLVALCSGAVKAFSFDSTEATEATVTFLSDDRTAERPKPKPRKTERPPGDLPPSPISPEKPLVIAYSGEANEGWSVMPKDVVVTIEVEPFLPDMSYFDCKTSTNGELEPVIPKEISTYMRPDLISQTGQNGAAHPFSEPCLRFRVATDNPDYKIAGVVIFAEGVFPGESYYHHLPEHAMRSNTSFPISVPNNVAVDMFVTVMAGQEYRKFYHCHGELVRLKRFSMFYNIPENGLQKPSSYVKFALKERMNRFVLWAYQHFYMLEHYRQPADEKSLTIPFVSLRNGKALILEFSSDGNVTICSDCIETCGDVFESLCEEVKAKTLSSRCFFPEEFATLKETFSQIEEFQRNRQRHAAEIAERGSAIRAVLMKAEESKALENWSEAKSYYIELAGQNKGISSDFRIQIDSQQRYTTGLKFISQLIDRASRFRVGQPKTEMLSQCRIAVQSRDVNKLLRLVEFGTG